MFESSRFSCCLNFVQNIIQFLSHMMQKIRVFIYNNIICHILTADSKIIVGFSFRTEGTYYIMNYVNRKVNSIKHENNYELIKIFLTLCLKMFS